MLNGCSFTVDTTEQFSKSRQCFDAKNLVVFLLDRFVRGPSGLCWKVSIDASWQHKEFEGLKKVKLMSPQARHFLKDLSGEQLAALPTWDGNPPNLYQGVADNLMNQLPKIQQIAKGGKEMNAQILLAKIGGAFVPTGEPHLSAIGKR